MKEKISLRAILIPTISYMAVMWGVPALFIAIGGIPFAYTDYGDSFHPGYFGYVGLWHTIVAVAVGWTFSWYLVFKQD